MSGSEALDPGQHFDFIAPHPYSSNIEFGEDGQLHPALSKLSQIVLDATVKAWESHPEAQMVIAGETCYPGLPTTTDLMVQRAHNVAAVPIPEDAIVPLTTRDDGHGYNNTYLQTEGLADYFKTAGEDARVLSISLGYHIRRVMMTARAYGWNASFVTAEDVLHDEGVYGYDELLPFTAQLERSEKPIRLVNRLDRKGRLFNVLMEGVGPIAGTGPRVVDVVPGENGGFELIATTGKKRQKAVAAQAL